jgi:Ca2+-binding RTX toxin-like protein
MFNGVQGYFGTDDIELGAQIRTPVLISATGNSIVIQASDFIGQIRFIGAGLTVQTATLPNNLGTIPALTGGTITGIEVLYNPRLENLQAQLALPNLTTTQRNAVLTEIQLAQTVANLVPNATIALPNVSAAALGTAVVQSYSTGSKDPLQAFFDQFGFVFTGTNETNLLSCSVNNDLLIGLGGPDNLFGFAGNDTLIGGSGIDGMNGGAGSDLYLPGPGADSIGEAILGPDSVGIDTISYIDATAGVTIDLNGNDGDQGAGDAQGDIIIGIEIAIGSNFNDIIFGNATPSIDADTLIGGRGDDQLFGLEGDDRLIGGAGFDILDGGGGASAPFAAPVGDTAVYAAGPNDVHFFVGAGNQLLIAAPGEGVDVLRNIERLDLGGQIFGINQINLSAAQLLVGDEMANTLQGGAQQDLLFGRTGNDRLDGNDGSDILSGGDGNDRLIGGAGNDDLRGDDGTDTLNGGDGDDLIFGGDSMIDLRDLVFAGAGNDSVDGGYGNDEIFGQGGNDTIAGGFGSDTLQGQDGNDVLTGSALSDLVFGNAGDDFVNGGFGHDRINGGTGADRFFHLGILYHGSDFIQDYYAADGDLLFSGIAGATSSQFQVNLNDAIAPDGEKAGDDAVQEAFVIYRPTGQILWALIDGAGQSEINIRIGTDTFDLLA